MSLKIKIKLCLLLAKLRGLTKGGTVTFMQFEEAPCWMQQIFSIFSQVYFFIWLKAQKSLALPGPLFSVAVNTHINSKL